MSQKEESTRILAVTSGKGGVGKTNVSVNLALQLSLLGQKTCVLDADLGLANINILLGLSPEYDLEDVVLGRRSLQDIMIKNVHGIDVIPGSSGVERIANLDHREVNHLIRAFSELRGYDFLLIDTSAGVNKGIISFCLASSDILIIITPEPTSVTDAYALLKILSLNGYKGLAKIVVNQCRNPQSATALYKKFKETVKTYLSLDLALLGIIVKDRSIEEAVRHQQAFVLGSPQSNAAKCIRYLANRLFDHQPMDFEMGGIDLFMTRYLELMKTPLKVKPSLEDNGSPESETLKSESDERMPQSVTEDDREEGGEEVEEQDADFIHPKGGTPEVPLRNASSEVCKLGIASVPFPNNGDLTTLLNRLITEVSTISLELGLLRKAIEENAGIGLFMNGSLNGKDRKGDRQEVLLDFVSFMKNHSIP